MEVALSVSSPFSILTRIEYEQRLCHPLREKVYLSSPKKSSRNVLWSRQDAVVCRVIPLFLDQVRMAVEDRDTTQVPGALVANSAPEASIQALIKGSVAASICSWEETLIALSASISPLGLKGTPQADRKSVV